MIASGKDVEAACALAGVTRATYYRWSKAEASGGVAALHDGKPTGRPKTLTLTEAEAAGLRGCALLQGSMEGGVRLWMEESRKPLEARLWPELEPASPATLAHLERLAAKRARGARAAWPADVRRAARVTRAEAAHLRGAKAVRDVTPHARRAMIWIDETGETHQVLPGSIWESDDMSRNEPFRYHDTELGRETVGRQALLTNDVFSHAMLGETLVGRRRDAYRVEDIADHLRDIVLRYGLPLVWRFERGVWDNGFIYGVKAPPSWLLGEDFRFGGLDGHLFRCAQKHSSQGKGGIENAFRAYQDFLKHRFTSIGQRRGEFEKASKLYRAALEGNPKALAFFWSIAEAAEAGVEALTAYNARPQIRRAFANTPAAPADLWRDHRPRPCPEEELWRFHPVKRPITVRQGVVEMKVEHYPLSFRFLVHGAPGLPCLEHGHRLFAAFHPAKPHEGCVLFNAETPDSPRNRDRLRLLERVGTASHWPDAPQENFAAAARAFDPQRRASAALRAEFRAAFPSGAGGVVRKSTARDGMGAQLAIATGAPPPETAAALSPAETELPRRRRAASARSLLELQRQALKEAEDAELNPF